MTPSRPCRHSWDSGTLDGPPYPSHRRAADQPCLAREGPAGPQPSGAVRDGSVQSPASSARTASSTFRVAETRGPDASACGAAPAARPLRAAPPRARRAGAQGHGAEQPPAGRAVRARRSPGPARTRGRAAAPRFGRGTDLRADGRRARMAPSPSRRASPTRSLRRQPRPPDALGALQPRSLGGPGPGPHPESAPAEA